MKPNKEARIRALKNAWKDSEFYCYYSGVKLLEDNPHSPRYLTFDHQTPRNENDIVVCAALVNDMKSDMDETEFWDIAAQLLDYHHGKGPPLEEEVLDSLKSSKR
jgi:hypothetical protein